MASLMDAYVDGLITDYPDRLRELMAQRGLDVPRAYPLRAEVTGKSLLANASGG